MRNINQFQSVYSFLIAPIFYLSGVFFPVAEKSLLGVIVEFSPFYHGVTLIQFTVWGVFPVSEILWHGSALLAFAALMGGLSFGRIGRKLTT